MDVIAQGAEAVIIKKDKDTLEKIREEKPYRVALLDKKIRQFRTKREFKVLTKLHQNNLNVPEPLKLNAENYSFEMTYIEGKPLKTVMTQELLFKAFEQIMNMHKQEIIHGDLTTLNMIVHNNEIYLIDFGLAEFSHKTEDRAVDLNLFFTCIKNEHPDFFKHKEQLIKEYDKLEFGNKVIEQLTKVEHRGRNK